MILKPWWEKWAGLLEYEIKELEKAGFQVTLDQKAKDRDRVIVLHIRKIPESQIKELIHRDELRLRVVFPGTYPYMKPTVFTVDDLPLIYHMNPIHKNLCLLNATEYWNDEDTAADLIDQQLYKTLKAGLTQDFNEAKALEYPQGEPETAYFSYATGSSVIYDSSWEIDKAADKGFFKLGIHPQFPLNMALLEISDASGRILKQADEALFELYGARKVRGRWLRLDKLVMDTAGHAFLQDLKSRERDFLRETMNQEIGVGGSSFEFFGALFPEDALQRTKRDGWQFLIMQKHKINKTYHPGQVFFARPMRAGKADMYSRIPELTGLKKKKIAIVGIGCVGAPSALEFAKSGVAEMRLLDGDYIEAGTTVRWPFGISTSGHNKVEIIANFIKSNYPYTRVLPINHTVGSCFYPRDGMYNDYDALEKLLDGVDLVYDASSERELMNIISDLATEIKIPYLRVSTNWGAWGGIVARIMPGKDACYSCLTLALGEESLLEYRIDSPHSDEKGFFQPTGCANPTFTGASFDVNIISMTGVRVAISTLLNGEEGQYPSFDKDVCIINLRDREGRAIPPSFTTHELRRHPRCRNH